MRSRLPMQPPGGELVGTGLTVRALEAGDAHRLGELMFQAYRGGVEDRGEPLEWHVRNAVDALSGQASYGAPIWQATLGAFDGSRLVAATVVTDDVEDSTTLLAFALVAPDCQGRGIGGELILASASVLSSLGHQEWALAVADGNPAKHLYDRLGFEAFTPPRGL